MPKSQMMMVLQTSARDLDTGEMSLDTVTAIGTEIPMEMMRPILSSKRRRSEVTCSQ